MRKALNEKRIWTFVTFVVLVSNCWFYSNIEEKTYVIRESLFPSVFMEEFRTKAALNLQRRIYKQVQSKLV